MVVEEVAVAEPDGHLGGYESAVFEQLEALEKQPIVKEIGTEQLSRNSSPETAESAVPASTKVQPKPSTVHGSAPKPKKASGKSPTAPAAPKPAASKGADKAPPGDPRIKYVAQAKLNAELTKLEDLSRAALAGDTTALDQLRTALDGCPHIWQRLADLQILVEQRLIQLVAGNDPLRIEAFRKKCSGLRHDLLDGPSNSLLTQMAASRVVATFMFVQLLELRALQSPNELRNLKNLEQGERRFQAAVRSLLLTKRCEAQLAQQA